MIREFIVSAIGALGGAIGFAMPVSYTHLRAHET